MDTEGSKTKKKESHKSIATPLNASSYGSGGGGGGTPGVTINFVNPSDELNGVYLGQDVFLAAELEKGRPDDYDFRWETDRGSFIGIRSKLIGVTNADLRITTEESARIIRLSTRGAGPGPISTTVIATRKATAAPDHPGAAEYPGTADYPGGAETCDPTPPAALRNTRVIPLREPSVSDLKGNFDQKMDGIAAEIGGSGNSGGIGQRIDQVADTIRNGISVRLQRSGVVNTDDLALWVVIRRSTEAINFTNYSRFMNMVLCGLDESGNAFRQSEISSRLEETNAYNALRELRFLPFSDADAYRLLKVATEAFLLVNGGVVLNNFAFIADDIAELNTRLGGAPFNLAGLGDAWDRYLEDVNGTPNATLPYLALIRSKLSDEQLKRQIFLNEDPLLGQANVAERCIGVLRRKLVRPFLLELIWSYWEEEGMLVQTLNCITRRFQNLRGPNGDRDPLANLEIDPLRPLSNLIWGYLQDEQHRLGVARRSSEYGHEYGIHLEGKAVPHFRPADNRSRFIEAFHHLLYLSTIFFKQDDDTTVIADGFPILNALREVHLILSQGAHNQFGDLPSTARQEMLLQQWLLARPEFREVLPTRIMVAYPEPWMDRVDAMKSLQGWSDVTSVHFHNLAVFGEQVLLSIRFGAWSIVNQPAQAANWARFWRAEIQGYIHAYRAATGVDVTSSDKVDSTPPSVHLRSRLRQRA